MKKNIVIIILSIITVILIYKIMNPTVVTERRSVLTDKYSEFQPNNKVENQDTNTEKNNSDTKDSEHKFNQDLEKIREFPNHSTDEEIRFPKPKQADNHFQKENQDGLGRKLKDCKQYKETLNAEYMGMNIDYEIEILGWQDKKCILNFTSRMTGISSDFENLYGIDASDVQITGFVPNIRCEFTKAQLLWVGDAILQENERRTTPESKMLKNPNDIIFPEFENMSLSDLKLLQIITDMKTCKIVNLDELKTIFNQFGDFLN